MKKFMCVFVLIAVAIGMFSIAMPAEELQGYGIPEVEILGPARKEAIKQGKLVLMVFSKKDCGPCNLLNMAYREVEFKKKVDCVVLAMVETTVNPLITRYYGVTRTPSLLMVDPKSMEPIYGFLGFVKEETFLQEIRVGLTYTNTIAELEKKFPATTVEETLRIAKYYEIFPSQIPEQRRSAFYYGAASDMLRFKKIMTDLLFFYDNIQEKGKKWFVDYLYEDEFYKEVVSSLEAFFRESGREFVRDEDKWLSCMIVMWVLEVEAPPFIFDEMRSSAERMAAEAKRAGDEARFNLWKRRVSMAEVDYTRFVKRAGDEAWELYKKIIPSGNNASDFNTYAWWGFENRSVTSRKLLLYFYSLSVKSVSLAKKEKTSPRVMAAYIDTLANWSEILGKKKKALALFRQAEKLDPKREYTENVRRLASEIKKKK